MPGYTIHIAVAKEYERKHKNEIKNYNEFIEGIIYPDSVKDKSLTHYGKESSKTNLSEFLKENKLENDFKKGYFIHLLTDYLFYNKYLEKVTKDVYNDYDLLNKMIIERYKIEIPEKVKNEIHFKENGELKILSIELVNRFIDEVSNLKIKDIEKEIKIDPEKWIKIRE